MANKAQTITQDLDKTLTVNGQEYNINAVRSDKANSADRAEKAGELEHYLKIVEYGDETNTTPSGTKEFIGKANCVINIVPADTGGTYVGPVNFSGHATTPDLSSEELTETSIINVGQLETKIEQLTGLPIFSWTGEKLEAMELTDGSTLQKLTVITGTEAAYASLITSNKCPEAFLYLSIDKTNDIYLKVPSKNPVRISSTNILRDGNGTNHYTAALLANSLSTITSTLGIHSAQLSTHGASITNISNIVCKDILDNWPESSGVVKKAVNADEAEHADEANHADSADSATKATKDGTDLEISKNYYRSASPYNTATNSITISASEPSGGTNGDIWIVYK